MEIYLVQHGESKPESEDPERPLTEKGRADVEAVAHYVGSLEIKVTQIQHSGKLRAKQTAEIFAQHLAPPQGAIEQEGLGPLDNPYKAKQIALQAGRTIMIVGHLPHLSRLASLLISGDPDKEVVRFRMGGVVCLGENDSSWVLNWAFVPEIVRA